MRRDLRNRRILLTGASRGIGRAVAEQLATAGARVVLTARSAESLEELASALKARGGQAYPIVADITQDADRQRLVEESVNRLGGLDVLINNAGVSSWGHFATSTEEVMRQVMEVNFFAPAELIRLTVPHLIRGQQPAIVNVASICGRQGLPAWPEHSASKHALCGLTEALRGELARFDIDILLVLPGLTKTNPGLHLLRNAGRYPLDYDRATPPETVAEGVIRVLRKNRTESAIGWDARLLLFFGRFFPRLLNWGLARKVRQLYANS